MRNPATPDEVTPWAGDAGLARPCCTSTYLRPSWGILLGASVVGNGHHGGDAHLHGGAGAASLLSLRVWTYLLAFGGATVYAQIIAANTVPAVLRARVGINRSMIADEAPRWLGARREHGRRHVTDEQRRQRGWIGREGD